MNIEMRHLRYFVAVAEEASFTAAAQRVHVAQQVLSTQIRQLEGAIGSELLLAGVRGGQQLSRMVPQLAGVTAAPGWRMLS